jgi:hypothetical protein
LQVPTLGLPGILGFPSCGFGCGIISDYHNEGGYVVGDYNGEVLCPDNSACVTWSGSAGMWSPDPATPCWGGDALCPAREYVLIIRNVKSYSIQDTEKVGTYDFDVLEFDPSTHRLRVRTNIPITISVVVRDLDIWIEELALEDIDRQTDADSDLTGHLTFSM